MISLNANSPQPATPSHLGSPRPERAIVLWCPDWPIIAAARSHGFALSAVVALIEKGVVFACSAAARSEGVRRGMRVREAQSRCPDVQVFDYEPALDIRSFEPVLEAIEEAMPGVQLLKPGTCAIRARGPAKYYGGEEEAALWLLDALDELGITGGRVGIADGPFTAEHAARSTANPRSGAHSHSQGRIRIVPEGGSARFLAAVPVGLLGEPALATLLRRLGIRTLGEFAGLTATDVGDRFGETGARLHALASGLDSRPVVARIPPNDLDESVDFEPPLDRIDQVAFGVKAAASRFIDELIRAQLVCTSVRIEIESETVDEFSERHWLHPRSFTAADVVDRVRWQLQGGPSTGSGSTGSGSTGSSSTGSSPTGSSSGVGLSSGVRRVRIVPTSVDAIGNHEQGLWGTGYDERIHHGLSRVQSLLGHGAVVTAAIGGGRTLLDRQKLVAWGDRAVLTKSAEQPWPGQLPTPMPGTIFEIPQPAIVLNEQGASLDIDERGTLNGNPSQLSTDGRSLSGINGWAGPWPINERWWDADNARSAHRFQLIDENGSAWLFVLENHLWWIEARYD